MEYREAEGLNEPPPPKEDEDVDEEEEEQPTGTMAAAEVLNKFKISDYDCIETEVLDSLYNGN